MMAVVARRLSIIIIIIVLINIIPPLRIHHPVSMVWDRGIMANSNS